VTAQEPQAYRRTEGLDWREVADGYVVYDERQELVHFLNLTAAAILELCDGKTNPDAMALSLQESFDLPDTPRADVETCLAALVSQGLISPCGLTESTEPT
jgi:hypothetical protein